ncbi:hypothetical protein [Sporomusa aerivorans]|uniref:hypothetical protein n=1 Tax=Sporomusa aerivorans TaxID=204936 RepID=UPI00352B92E4
MLLKAFYFFVCLSGDFYNAKALKLDCKGDAKMYNFIMANKWAILLILEIFAWSFTVFMFYARYKMQSSFWFKLASAMLVLTGVIPQVLLGVLNFAATKEMDLFSLVLVLLILYGCTIGRKHVQKLDSWVQKNFVK